MKHRFVLGIGNPDPEYEGTRHNVAWWVLDELAHRTCSVFERAGGIAARAAEIRIKNVRLRLIKPTTYVNRTGDILPAVRRMAEGVMERILVVCDDANLPVGRIRVRPAGSSGGHNGLQSLIDALGHDRFPRLRIGIGRVPGSRMTEHVLGRFGPEEEAVIREAVQRAADAVQLWALEGLQACMNRFNRNAESKEGGGKNDES